MRELNFIEIEAEHIELLPTRETMNVFGSNWAGIVATNSSLALNAASIGALGFAILVAPNGGIRKLLGGIDHSHRRVEVGSVFAARRAGQ